MYISIGEMDIDMLNLIIYSFAWYITSDFKFWILKENKMRLNLYTYRNVKMHSMSFDNLS